MAVVGVLAILAAIVGLRWSVTTDITHFLADHEDAELAAISRELAGSELTRAWIVTIGGAPEEEVAAAAVELRDRLSQESGLRPMARGLGDAAEDFYRIFYPRRFYFFSDDPEAAAAALDDAALRERARELLRGLSLPQAPLYKQIAPGDPLLTFPAILDRLRAAEAGGLHPVGDALVTGEGHAVLFLATDASPFDGAAMAPVAAAIDRAIAEVDAAHGGRLEIEQSAVARFALTAERSIRADVTRISILSTLGLLLVFLVMLRSPRLVVLVLLPLAVGVLAAMAATLLLFGAIHGLTLAFGATLIGVAIDYSVHFFNHHMLDPAPGGPTATLRRIWPGLALGAATTVAGFLGLAWTSFPGLREMAVFACVGVVGALLAVRLLLPPLMPTSPAPGAIQRAAAALCGRALAAMGRARRGLALALVVVVGLTALGLGRLEFVDDIRAFSQVDPELLAEDERVRGRVSRMDAGRFFIAIGDDEEAALDRSDALARRLGDALAAGEVAEVRSLHALVWSAALQRRSLAALRAAPGLVDRVNAAYEAEGFRPGALAPFARDLAAEPPPPLTIADLEGTALAELVHAFRVDLGRRVGTDDGPRGRRRREPWRPASPTWRRPLLRPGRGHGRRLRPLPGPHARAGGRRPGPGPRPRRPPLPPPPPGPRRLPPRGPRRRRDPGDPRGPGRRDPPPPRRRPPPGPLDGRRLRGLPRREPRRSPGRRRDRPQHPPRRPLHRPRLRSPRYVELPRALRPRHDDRRRRPPQPRLRPAGPGALRRRAGGSTMSAAAPRGQGGGEERAARAGRAVRCECIDMSPETGPLIDDEARRPGDRPGVEGPRGPSSGLESAPSRSVATPHRVAPPRLDAVLRRVTAALLVALALAGACAHGRTAADGPPPIDEALLVDVATIPGDFLARQRVSGTMGERTLGSEVVLQKQGGTLTLLGLTPFGTRAFAVIQEGKALRVESFMPEALPFPPELMILDVHRALFLGERPQPDGRHRFRVGDERVDDTWSGGRLLRRVFRRRRAPRGDIVVDYGEGMAGGQPPPTITIDNQIFGYTVTIETVSFQPLPP
ncbi:MAG: DUF3261 domain-containing protein [Nannocystaceae bacterium]